MRTLYLPIKKKSYELIESGVMTEVYIEIISYWINRLRDKSFNCPDKACYNFDCELSCFLNYCKFDRFEKVVTSYGYGEQIMSFEIESISIGIGKLEWGAPADKEVFIIKLGKRI